MMKNYITSTLNWLKQHSKKIITIIVFGIFIQIGISSFLNYAVIDLSVIMPLAVKKNDLVAYVNHDTQTKQISGSGLSIIPRSSKTITVMTKNKQMRSISTVAIPWFGFASKKITINPDLNADKIAFRSSRYNTCASYDNSKDRLLSFACSDNSGLTYYNTTGKDWFNSLITATEIDGQVSAYRGGVIGLSSTTNSGDGSYQPAPIRYISSNGTRHYYPLPKDFLNYSNLKEIVIVTDPTDSSNSHYILLFQGTIYLASVDINDTVSYITLPAPTNYSVTYHQTICSFKTINIYCYRGNISTDTSSKKSNGLNPTIIQASFNGSDTKVYSTDIKMMDSLYVTTSGLLFSKNYKSLLYLKKINDTYVTQAISDNVDSASAGTNIYFVDDLGIFTYNPETEISTQVFRSANILPKRIIPIGNKIFILGYVANDKDYTYTYAWVLSNEQDKNYGKRIIDLLPLFSSTYPYSNTDFVGKKVNIAVQYNKSSIPSSISQQKQITLDYLKMQGINVEELTLANP